MDAPPDRLTRIAVPLGLACLFALGVVASTGPGITWDEPGYVAAGYGYCRWLGDPDLSVLPRNDGANPWLVNHEHPPAAKLVYGLAGILERGRTFPAMWTARIAAVGLFVVLVGLVYGLVARHYGRLAGALAALSLALMPRVFGHAHLAALDAPAALACFAATLVFSRAHTGRRWAVGAGLLWGVALLTKLNAVFLPLVLVPWALGVHRKRALLPCALLLVLGPLVFVAGWPWLWRHTGDRIAEYTVDKIERAREGDRLTGTTNVPVHYLGTTYRDRAAPWHYPFVLTLATVPLGLLVLAGFGVRPALARSEHSGRPFRAGEEERGIGALIITSGLLHLGVAAVPGAPKYDGVRLFLPAFPFIACLVGVGGAWVWKRWSGTGRKVVAAVFILTAVALVHAHPYELSYYNALVGGAWGANRLGFETTYWGDTVNRRVMADVNALCPPRSTIAVWPPYQAFLDALPWMREDLIWLKGWRPGLPSRPDFLLVFPRQGYLGDFGETLLKTSKPVRRWTYLGVPQCMLFDLRRARVQAAALNSRRSP